jgi:hypothetical protein
MRNDGLFGPILAGILIIFLAKPITMLLMGMISNPLIAIVVIGVAFWIDSLMKGR